MLYGEELLKSIQNRCRIQPGMLIRSRPEGFGENAPHGGKGALVTKVSPGCKFDRDYEGAEEHIFYVCEPFDGTNEFVDYVCNMEQVS